MANKSRRDADFTEKTKRVIAARAGYRCSWCGCDDATIGPGAESSDVESKGVAAHIFAASPGGPRGTGGLAVEERKSPANGFWACEDHAKIIDNDAGKNYPASQLQSWKALHEQRIANEVRKLTSASGAWIHAIEIQRSPLFTKNARITLGKMTLLFGSNGTGKTALCEWLSAAGGVPQYLERWRDREVVLGIEVVASDRRKIVMSFDGCGMRHTTDGENGRAGDAFRVVYVSDRRMEWRDNDEVATLAGVWGVHEYEVPQIVEELCWDRYGFVKHAEIRESIESVDEDDPESEQVKVRRLLAQIGHHNRPLSLGMMSGREMSQIIVSGAMVVANWSRERPTVLIVELGGQLLPDVLLGAYAERLSRPDFNFQTILVTPTERPEVTWGGWSVVRLVGRPPKTSIEQNVIS